jgi:(2Fe-2S) ferredoxin
LNHYKKHIFICTNQKSAGQACCANTGGKSFFEHLKTTVKELGIHGPGQYRVSQSGCLGRCSVGPALVIYPEAVWYTYASVEDLDEIVDRHLLGGSIVERLLIPSFEENLQ